MSTPRKLTFRLALRKVFSPSSAHASTTPTIESGVSDCAVKRAEFNAEVIDARRRRIAERSAAPKSWEPVLDSEWVALGEKESA